MTRDPIVRSAASLVMVALMGAGCAGAVTPAAKPATTPSVTPTTTSTKPPRPPRTVVALPRLPQRGFVVASRTGVTFVALDGAEIHALLSLRGFYVTGDGGGTRVWLSKGRHYYRFDVARYRLVLLTRREALAQMSDEGPAPDLPTPEDQVVHCKSCPPEGMEVGHWRYALPSPDGSVLLGQYSGECEVPTAYWIEDGNPRVIADDSAPGAPESVALGWSPRGAAFVYLGEGYCGGRGDPPGIYAFGAPDNGELVYETPPHVSVQMWGPG